MAATTKRSAHRGEIGFRNIPSTKTDGPKGEPRYLACSLFDVSDPEHLPQVWSSLDYISIVSPPTVVALMIPPPFTNTPTNTKEPYLHFLDLIFNRTSAAHTITASYRDGAQTVPPDHIQTICNGFVKPGTVLLGSGDFAVGGVDCLSINGENGVKPMPITPASRVCL